MRAWPFVLVCLMAAAPAQAQMTPQQAVVSHVQALTAVTGCKVRTFSDAEHDKIAVIAMQARGFDMLAGDQLNLTNQARGEMEARISSLGCRDAKVLEAIGFFNTQIAPKM